MPLNQGGPHTNEGAKERHPFKKALFHQYNKINIGSSNVKMVADRHRHAAYHSKHWQ